MTDLVAKAISRAQVATVDARVTLPREKQGAISTLFNVLQENKSAVIQAVVTDTGRTETEVTLELVQVVRHLKQLYDETDFHTLMKKEKDEAKSGKIEKPVGWAAVVSHDTAPLDSLFTPIASAVATGNYVVAILPPSLPTLSQLLTTALFPLQRVAFTVIPFSSSNLAALLASNPPAVVATSLDPALRSQVSQTTGRSLVLPALTGPNTVVVDKCVNPKSFASIARDLVRAKFFNIGLSIGAADVLLVHEAVKDAVVEAVIQETRTMFGGDAELSRDYGRFKNVKEAETLVSVLRSEREKGEGRVVLGGTSGKGGFLAPTIVDGALRTSDLATKSFKGPVLPIISYSSFEDVLSILASNPGCFTFAFADGESIEYLARELPGLVLANTIPFETAVGNPAVPTSTPRFDASIFVRASFIVRTTGTPLSSLYAPFTSSRLSALARLFPAAKTLRITRTAHTPILRRSFFPQGLFLLAGTIVSVILGSTGFGLFKLVQWYTSRRV
ncbi:ALDH-like protein [Meredithblackwellia eburnea MCA 4105]